VGKIVKVIIAGGRRFNYRAYLFGYMDAFNSFVKVSEVVSGGASGADAAGEDWASARGIPVKRFPADWEGLGRAAGPARNGEMAEYAGALVAFPGGKGTENMIGQARSSDLDVYVVQP
jgi:hypothetical protein